MAGEIVWPDKPPKKCPNCGEVARNDGGNYDSICTQWPRCGRKENDE